MARGEVGGVGRGGGESGSSEGLAARRWAIGAPRLGTGGRGEGLGGSGRRYGLLTLTLSSLAVGPCSRILLLLLGRRHLLARRALLSLRLLMKSAGNVVHR